MALYTRDRRVLGRVLQRLLGFIHVREGSRFFTSSEPDRMSDVVHALLMLLLLAALACSRRASARRRRPL